MAERTSDGAEILIPDPVEGCPRCGQPFDSSGECMDRCGAGRVARTDTRCLLCGGSLDDKGRCKRTPCARRDLAPPRWDSFGSCNGAE